MLDQSPNRGRRRIAALVGGLAFALLACGGTATSTKLAATLTPVPGVPPAPTASPMPPAATATPTPATLCVSADGDGVFVRSEPDMEKKVKAWPDGTRMVVLEEAPAQWAKVRAPDDYVGYVPRKYLVVCPSTSPQPTDTPRRSPTTSPTRPGSTSDPTPASGVGYLWYSGNEVVGVPVIGDVHQENPASAEQLRQWILQGEACVAERGSRATQYSGKAPPSMVFVEVQGGGCLGFRGWVPMTTFHSNLP